MKKKNESGNMHGQNYPPTTKPTARASRGSQDPHIAYTKKAHDNRGWRQLTRPWAWHWWRFFVRPREVTRILAEDGGPYSVWVGGYVPGNSGRLFISVD